MIEHCAVLVIPPMRHHFPHLHNTKNVNLTKTKKDMPKCKTLFLLWIAFQIICNYQIFQVTLCWQFTPYSVQYFVKYIFPFFMGVPSFHSLIFHLFVCSLTLVDEYWFIKYLQFLSWLLLFFFLRFSGLARRTKLLHQQSSTTAPVAG